MCRVCEWRDDVEEIDDLLTCGGLSRSDRHWLRFLRLVVLEGEHVTPPQKQWLDELRARCGG